jgi:hypothetical protein
VEAQLFINVERIRKRKNRLLGKMGLTLETCAS